jgi:hypothetical protein
MTCMGNPTAHVWPTKRLLVWAIFGFAFAMIPVLFAKMGDDLGETTLGFREMVERGDIYLICVALVGDSLGRYVMISKKKIVDILGVGYAIAFAIMVAFEFGTINAMLHGDTPVPVGLVQRHSCAYVASVMILGCAAVIRTEN